MRWGIASAPVWNKRYEALRAEALNERRISWGMTVVVRRGLTAWMHAWPRESESSSQTLPVEALAPQPTYVAPEPGIITVLASMVLSTSWGGAA